MLTLMALQEAERQAYLVFADITFPLVLWGIVLAEDPEGCQEKGAAQYNSGPK